MNRSTKPLAKSQIANRKSPQAIQRRRREIGKSPDGAQSTGNHRLVYLLLRICRHAGGGVFLWRRQREDEQMHLTSFIRKWAATAGTSIPSPGNGAFRPKRCAVPHGRTSGEGPGLRFGRPVYGKTCVPGDGPSRSRSATNWL